MKIGITGGTGFVGSHLAEALLEAGHEVVQVARRKAIGIPGTPSETGHMAHDVDCVLLQDENVEGRSAIGSPKQGGWPKRAGGRCWTRSIGLKMARPACQTT